jgi:simple sugar transport system ATP-binding protein
MLKNILCMENISKVYSNGFVANKNVHFAVDEGEIHSLVGENGAGKTTLMKILFGIENSDSGRILLRDEEIHIGSPTAAIKRGIGMVHQHFMLVPSLSVAENLVVGMEPKKLFCCFDMKEAVHITEESMAKYKLNVNPLAKIQDLSVGQKQKVEILKALVRGAHILILDEPTAVLTPQETKELFSELKSLKNDGYTIVFISHKLNEVKELSDRVTVMRNGRSIGTSRIEDVNEQSLSRMMVGREVILKIQKDKARAGDPVLEVKNLTKYGLNKKKKLNNVSLTLRQGEILGVAGVEGNGQKELSDAVTGMDRIFEGTITIGKTDILAMADIRKIREAGLAHISEDRMVYGIVGDGSISDNLISDRYYKKEFQKGLLLDFARINSLSDALIDEFQVACDGRDQPVRMLSGGNIQKIVAAREFSSRSTLIIANQPTRGIDVGASELIRKKLVELRDQGAGIMLISADLNEILEVSDSVIVLYEGKIAAYFEDASAVSEIELGEYMLGIKFMDAASVEKAVSHV